MQEHVIQALESRSVAAAWVRGRLLMLAENSLHCATKGFSGSSAHRLLALHGRGRP